MRPSVWFCGSFSSSSSPGEAPLPPWAVARPERASSHANIFVGVGLLGRRTSTRGLSGEGDLEETYPSCAGRSSERSAPTGAAQGRSASRVSAASLACSSAAVWSIPCIQWLVCSGVGAFGRCTGIRGDEGGESGSGATGRCDSGAAALLLAPRHMAMASSIREAGALRLGMARPREEDGRAPPLYADEWPLEEEGRLLGGAPAGAPAGLWANEAIGGGGSGTSASSAAPSANCTDSRPERSAERGLQGAGEAGR